MLSANAPTRGARSPMLASRTIWPTRIGSSGNQNLDLEAKFWNKLKRPKIIARKPFSLEIVEAVLGARFGIWKLTSGVN